MSATYGIVMSTIREGTMEWIATWPDGGRFFSLGSDPRNFTAALVQYGWTEKATLKLSDLGGPVFVVFTHPGNPSAGFDSSNSSNVE